MIPSPTWLPRTLSLFSLSLSPSLSLFSFFSPPQRRSLSRRLLSPLLSGTRACVTGGGGDFSFLSSLLTLFFSSLHREWEKSLLPLSRSFSLLLFFLSLSPSLPRPRVSLYLSLATEISVDDPWRGDEPLPRIRTCCNCTEVRSPHYPAVDVDLLFEKPMHNFNVG